jgi:ribosomal protein S18 acetylase RimI-like enzyme
MRSSQVTLRPATSDDEMFLEELYGDTRAAELTLVDWSDAQKREFVHMQFTAQSRCYRENYPDAEFRIIEVDGQPAGRLYVEPRVDDIRIMDVSLLPAFRGQGIGTALLTEVLNQAGQSGKSASIHVETFNPASRLYERLGFRQCATNGMYHLMKWSPGCAAGVCAGAECRGVR